MYIHNDIHNDFYDIKHIFGIWLFLVSQEVILNKGGGKGKQNIYFSL